jgi:hypothetical protein
VRLPETAAPEANETMPASSPAKPILTVMISPREGHGLSEASLSSVLADDSLPFDLVWLDVLTPPATLQAVEALRNEKDFAIVRFEGWIAPAAARKAALERIATPYVLFIDNDVFVEPGAFQRLVACAEETGAGLVAPLYLEGDGRGPRAIHMAGGVLERDATGALVREAHGLAHARAGEAARLVRSQIDYPEYHCLLARTDLVRREGVISDDVLLVHEHIDLALKARVLGAGVWMEPTARVTFGGLERRLGDLAFFLRRWDEAACEASLEAFARRWPIADADAFFVGVRAFVRDRGAAARPFHPGARGAGLGAPMTAAELAQTRTALREQALARGYSPDDARAFEAAGDFATLIFDSTYRADGRPFLNHVIGTASALVRYDFRREVVMAGLLHAAYTHRPDWMAPAEIARVLGPTGPVDAIVRALPHAKTQLASGVVATDLTLHETWALAIGAANEADMLLSGEYRASGRPREIAPAGLALLADVLTLAGAPGLAASADGAPGEGTQGPLLGFSPLHGSFRLDARNRRLAPVRPHT